MKGRRAASSRSNSSTFQSSAGMKRLILLCLTAPWDGLGARSINPNSIHSQFHFICSHFIQTNSISLFIHCWVWLISLILFVFCFIHLLLVVWVGLSSLWRSPWLASQPITAAGSKDSNPNQQLHELRSSSFLSISSIHQRWNEWNGEKREGGSAWFVFSFVFFLLAEPLPLAAAITHQKQEKKRQTNLPLLRRMPVNSFSFSSSLSFSKKEKEKKKRELNGPPLLAHLRLFTHKLSENLHFSSSLFISALRFARITVIILFYSFISQLTNKLKLICLLFHSFHKKEKLNCFIVWFGGPQAVPPCLLHKEFHSLIAE